MATEPRWYPHTGRAVGVVVGCLAIGVITGLAHIHDMAVVVPLLLLFVAGVEFGALTERRQP
jgi:Sec-independent protein secretion pathway component TatC